MRVCVKKSLLFQILVFFDLFVHLLFTSHTQHSPLAALAADATAINAATPSKYMLKLEAMMNPTCFRGRVEQHTHTRTHVSQTVDGDRGCEPQAWVSDWPRWSHQYPGHPYQAVAVGSMPFGAGLSTHKKVRVKESAGTECRRFEAIFYFKTKANVTSPPSNLNFNFRFLFQRNIARDQKMPTK